MKPHQLFALLLLPLSVGSFTGCTALQANDPFHTYLNPFRPMDEIKEWRQFAFEREYSDEEKFHSENPAHYVNEEGIPVGIPSSVREGWVISPHAPKAGLVDTRRFAEGEKVMCPFTGKVFVVPDDERYHPVTPPALQNRHMVGR